MSVNYSLGAGKPLISRDQNYVLDRKLLTVHSEDRDVSKWANANEFEIILPESLLNVQSMRLVEVQMPTNLYTFSNQYQNTRLDVSFNATIKSITVQEGSYTPDEMAYELTNRLNNPDDLGIQLDTSFNVFYDKVAQKMWFGHTDLSFALPFANQISYTTTCVNGSSFTNESIWQNNMNWGLGYYLGFNKATIISTDMSSNTTSTTDKFKKKRFNYLTPNKISDPNAVWDPSYNLWRDFSGNVPMRYYIQAPNTLNIQGDGCMYMEIEKYNSYDELYPYNQSNFDHSSSANIRLVNANNSSSGKVNSAFAKIPLNRSNGDGYGLESRNMALESISHYEPPIERIVRLKFRFRFHDGRLVDFKNNPFNFTLEFNMLKNEISKQYNVRIPATYTL